MRQDGRVNRIFLLFLLGLPWFASANSPAAEPAAVSGVMFACAPAQIARLDRDMAAYLQELGVSERQVVRTAPDDGTLVYTLATAEAGR